VDRALKAGALALGGAVEITTLPGYLPLHHDPRLVELFRANAVQVVGAEGVRDYTSGYRAYRVALLRRLAERFRPLVRARGFGVMTELLAKAAAEGARCREVPIMLRYDMKPGRSKLKLLPTLAEYGRVVTLARLDAWRTAPPGRAAGRSL
jgi:hypothetical protein